MYDIETNKCTTVYHIIHTLYLLHASLTHVAFLREVHYKGQVRRNIAEVFEPMHSYKILNFKNTTWFIIHIKDQNTDKNICD